MTFKLPLIAALALSTLLMAAPAQASAPCPTKWTSDGFVALRKGPGTQFPRVKKLWFPTAVDIYPSGHTANWLRVWVNNSNGIPTWKGYVRRTLIDLNNCG